MTGNSDGGQPLEDGCNKALRLREGLAGNALTALNQPPTISGYFDGGGVKTSRRVGSGLGLGFGAFLTSLRPLSLFPMGVSMHQNPWSRKGYIPPAAGHGLRKEQNCLRQTPATLPEVAENLPGQFENHYGQGNAESCVEKLIDRIQLRCGGSA